MYSYRFLLLLLASWMCFTNAAQDKNNIGGETVQNPKDPKYQKMARDIVENMMHLKNTKFVVLKVTTQVVAGTLTKIKIRIFFKGGQRSLCDVKIHERVWEKYKSVAYTCTDSDYWKVGSQNPGTASVESSNNYDDNKSATYLGYVKKAIRWYFKNRPGKFVIKRIEIKASSHVTTPVNQKILYFKVDVIIRPSTHYTCSVLFELYDEDPLSTHCIEDLAIDGGNYWEDPSKREYLNFAKKSLSKLPREYKKAKYNNVIVTFVEQAVALGFIDTIKFIVRRDDMLIFICEISVWEKPSGKNVIKNFNCDLFPGP